MCGWDGETRGKNAPNLGEVPQPRRFFKGLFILREELLALLCILGLAGLCFLDLAGRLGLKNRLKMHPWDEQRSRFSKSFRQRLQEMALLVFGLDIVCCKTGAKKP